MTEYFVTPVGRIVQGSVSRIEPKINERGETRDELFFAVAFEKQNPDWPPLLAMLQRVAQAAFPNGEFRLPKFSWKIIDGDGVDDNGVQNSTKEGFAGHWVVRFKTGFAIQALRNGQHIPASDIRCGDYVQVSGSVAGNGGGKAGTGTSKPGLYINPTGVQLIGHGPEIVGGPDIKQAFASGPKPTYMPPGMSATPLPPVGGSPTPAASTAPAAAPFSFPGSAPVTTPTVGTVGHAFANPAAPAPAAAAAALAPAPAPASVCPRGAPAGFRVKASSPWDWPALATAGHTTTTALRDGYVEQV